MLRVVQVETDDANGTMCAPDDAGRGEIEAGETCLDAGTLTAQQERWEKQ